MPNVKDFLLHPSQCTPSGSSWHRGRMLKLQPETSVGGRFEGLLGVVAEVVVPQPATGRSKREGASAHATHPWAKEAVAAVHAGWRG